MRSSLEIYLHMYVNCYASIYSVLWCSLLIIYFNHPPSPYMCSGRGTNRNGQFSTANQLEARRALPTTAISYMMVKLYTGTLMATSSPSGVIQATLAHV